MDTAKITILVVEDEHMIQDLLKDALETGGFEIVVAATGEEAIRLLNDPVSFRAIITDVNLGSNILGWDVARHAREIITDIPVIYMTGAAAHDWGAKGVPNSVLVTKPFAPAQIVTAVSQLINVGSTPGA